MENDLWHEEAPTLCPAFYFLSHKGISHLTDTHHGRGVRKGAGQGRLLMVGDSKGCSSVLPWEVFRGGVMVVSHMGPGTKCHRCSSSGALGGPQAVLGDAETHQNPGYQTALLTKAWRGSQATTNALKSPSLQQSQQKWTLGCLTSAE